MSPALEEHKMTKALLITFALGLATAMGVGRKPVEDLEGKLLETGTFHGEEVSARSGERWLGLHVTADTSTLLSYVIKVKAVHDEIVDEKEDQETGKEISVDLPVEPMFLVKGLPELSDGPVTTVFQGQTDFEKTIEKTTPVKLKLDDGSYELQVLAEEPTKCRESSFPKDAKLVLRYGDTTQVLYTLDGCGNEPYWYLLWAGDLDRDHKLHLYVSVTQHYNISRRRLFLSSKADQGKLVKEVAELLTGGC
jgi:hypothetical protein